MDWLNALVRLRRERVPAVLVTVTEVRGHGPRDAGAKMVVSGDAVWGTIGGGNLEESAIETARAALADGEALRAFPTNRTFRLSDKAPTRHGVQCCGGDVTVLFETLPVRPSVALFGMGHVGLEIARILARQDIELHLIDSRADQLTPERLEPLSHALADVRRHHARVPEIVLGEIPRGTHVLVLTHDHAEDIALCDMALRCAHLGSIGLIGSSAKRSRFRARLAAEGHTDEEIARITTPIGVPEITGKDPATIAVSVAAALLPVLANDREPGRLSHIVA